MVSPEDSKIVDSLSQALLHLGSPHAQARVMAAQLLKRARQIAVQRAVPEAVAMAELLEKIRQARSGEFQPMSESTDT